MVALALFSPIGMLMLLFALERVERSALAEQARAEPDVSSRRAEG